MLLEQILFFIAAIGALGGAIGVVALRNPFYSVLALVAHLIALATLFLLLRAEFLAAAQVVVYAGAVMVLYVFVVAYIGGVDEPLATERRSIATFGLIFAAALLAEIMIAVIGSGLSAVKTRGPHVPAGFGSPTAIGQLLLQQFLLVFEAASFLLLVAAVGAVVLARRRRGLERLGGDDLPDRVGRAPLGDRDGAGDSPLSPRRIPAGTAEGRGDPTVERGGMPAEPPPDREPHPTAPTPGAAVGAPSEEGGGA